MSTLSCPLLQAAPTPQSVERYTGTAYLRNSTAALYREVHFVYPVLSEQRQLVIYECPNGVPFARKVLYDSPASDAPNFDFIDGRSGYREGVRGTQDAREVYVQKSHDALEQSRKLPRMADAVIDAGFDAYVKDHWDLVGKSAATIPFLIPSRLSFANVRLSHHVDESDSRQAVRTLRMRLDAWYGFALPDITLSYTLPDHRLWRYEGVGSIRDVHGRNQDVRIEFPADARQRDVPYADLNAALAAALAGRCDG